ncbi:MAG: sulfatase-like hydrolase/transferase [Acidobacteriota bacterium]
MQRKNKKKFRDLSKEKRPKIKRKRYGYFFILGLVIVFSLLFIFKFFFLLSPYEKVKKLFKKYKIENPNVILISIDTLRADRISCYGFEFIKTEHIDSIAQEGVLFENCIVHVPLTLPSHASILTGTLPIFHNVRDNGGFVLDNQRMVLSEVFKKAGYKTSAFVGAFVLDSKWGLNQGFDYYFDKFDLSKYKSISLGDVQRRGDEVVNEALKWIENNKNKNFFSFIHLYDPHTPYEPPPPYDSLYPNRPYLGEIAFSDEQVGRILSFLEENELDKTTIIIFTSDHGESLGEHKEGTHGFFLYNAALQVPLIIKTPFRELSRKRVKTLVRSIDIMPTILEISGLEIPTEVQGRSLLELLFDSDKMLNLEAYSETFYPRYHFGWAELISIQKEKLKFIIAPKPEFYNLEEDLNEINNLYSEGNKIAKEMKAKLNSLIESYSAKEEIQYQNIDQETMEKLAALGYVGGFVNTAEESKNLADPKDKIELFNLLTSCKEDTLAGNFDKAIEKINKVIKEDPDIPDAYFSLGNTYFKMKNYEKAIESFKKTLELKPDYDFAMLNLANCYRILGKLDEAISEIETFLKYDPKDSQAFYILGDIYLEKKDYKKAFENFQKAVSFSTLMSDAFNGLGVIYYAWNDLENAEKNIKKALEINDKVRKGHFNLAQVYEKKGELEKAKEEYQKEIEIYPLNFRARFNLGKIYGIFGDYDSQIIEFREVIKSEPYFAIGYLYLAKAIMDGNGDLREAVDIAKKGISLGPEPEYLPLGHFILADIYNRMGNLVMAEQELQRGREIQARNRSK